ncbi:MAG: hypothetical protein COA79_02085 [Planctomycetota bacterium]|nr:MAG: hypothetical protein COA79_02085 [Planctomycetota bacterium]
MTDIKKNKFIILLLATYNGFFKHLPIWYFWLGSLMTAASSLSMFETPHYDFIWTIIFPWIVIFIYFYAHFKSSEKWKSPWVPLSSLFLITLALFIYIVLFTQKEEINLSEYKFTYEIVNLIWIFFIAVHCAWYRGSQGYIKFFMIATLYGFFLESSGVQMGFFSEEGYHFYVPGFHAPLITMIGWSVIFYPSVVIFEKYHAAFFKDKRINVLVGALAVSGIALFFDFQIDPFASAFGLWTWNETLAPWFLGVPLLNFVSWFWAVFTFAVGYYVITQKNEWSELKKNLVFLCSIPLIQTIAGIGVFSVMSLVEGINGASMNILKNYLSSYL